MKFHIDKGLKERGLRIAMVRITNAAIVNKKKELEEEKKEFIGFVDWKKIESSPIVEGYKKFYSDSALNPPALNLLRLVKRNGRFPNINTVVDAYNLISAKTLFSIGAHDISRIKGDIKFTVTTGNEKYAPLGSENNVKVNSDEYAAVDDEKMICHLDQKQCQQTRITKDTKEFIVYVQGNDATSQEEVNYVLGEVIGVIKRFCCGNSTILQEETETVNSTRSPVSMMQ